ncbi:YbaB/EbfC family nucleoid-associated protein [Nonomuraea antimicrobica]
MPADISAEEHAFDAEEVERILAWSERVQADIENVVGTGAGASGQITATVAADGTVLKVFIEERAMRLDSRTVAAEVLSAVHQAGADVARHIEKLIREGLPGFDPSRFAAGFERLVNLDI